MKLLKEKNWDSQENLDIFKDSNKWELFFENTT